MIPFTYLIGWSSHDKYYYGVRYAKNCSPSDLWTTYFTTSNSVKKYRELYGDPNIIQIRRTFKNIQSARLWESKVLNRMNAAQNPKFLNKRNGSWKWAVYVLTDEAKQKISNAQKGKPKSKESIAKRLMSMQGFRHTHETKQKIADSHRGVARSDQYKKKMKSKIWINNGIKTLRHDLVDPIPDGWSEGRIHSWKKPQSPKYIITNSITDEQFNMTRDEFCKSYGYKTGNIPCINSNKPMGKYRHWIITFDLLNISSEDSI